MPPLTPSPPLVEKVAETALAYYRQAQDLLFTAQELAGWVDALPAPQRQELHTLGLRASLHLPAFTRYVLEQRGYSMPAYMAARLTADELAHWVDDLDGGIVLQ